MASPGYPRHARVVAHLSADDPMLAASIGSRPAATLSV